MARSSEKVYQEFQKAAHRHLKTCIELKKVIVNTSENSLKKKLLEDLYYLTGYIIECSCCYFIFAYNSRNKLYTNREQLIATRTGFCEDNVTYDKASKKDNNTLIVKNSKHELREFKKIMSYFPECPNIPVLNGRIQPIVDELLFNKWQANIRYKIPKGLNCIEESVFSFLDIAKTLFEDIDNHYNNPNSSRNS